MPRFLSVSGPVLAAALCAGAPSSPARRTRYLTVAERSGAVRPRKGDFVMHSLGFRVVRSPLSGPLVPSAE